MAVKRPFPYLWPKQYLLPSPSVQKCQEHSFWQANSMAKASRPGMSQGKYLLTFPSKNKSPQFSLHYEIAWILKTNIGQEQAWNTKPIPPATNVLSALGAQRKKTCTCPMCKGDIWLGYNDPGCNGPITENKCH